MSYVVPHILNLSNLTQVTSIKYVHMYSADATCSTMESYSNSSARVPESSRNREDRLQRRRERERAHRTSETAEQREERLRVRRARDRARRAAQTAEERDARLRQIRDNRRACASIAFELTLAPTMLCIHLVRCVCRQRCINHNSSWPVGNSCEEQCMMQLVYT